MVRLGNSEDRINIEPHMVKIKQYLSDSEGVAAALLFGSYGTPYQTPLSDVDIAVLFRPGYQVSLDQELQISSDLSAISGEEDINLVNLNKAPLTLQFEVLSTGRTLIKKDLYLEDFHEYVCKRHADYRIDLDQFNRDYDAALREVYLKSGQ
ncbi:MAG TPA: nucleotidyltransferase domain-containing protein [Limnochordia bacterium]|nr:nucleotidyltransferase domain-containing protein [Bacillota bacterium]HKM16761.1 nucleotidyltransferase domain-containing protein [Limnochordia bacterium]